MEGIRLFSKDIDIQRRRLSPAIPAEKIKEIKANVELQKRKQKLKRDLEKAEQDRIKRYQKLYAKEIDDSDSDDNCGIKIKKVDCPQEEITVKSLNDYSSLLEYKPLEYVDIFDENEGLPPAKPSGKYYAQLLAHKTNTKQLLNYIYPPKYFKTSDGIILKQSISDKRMTRSDIRNLNNALNVRLDGLETRSSGLCSKRRHFYDECFNEMVRQLIVENISAGLLLLRIRDEKSLSLYCYETALTRAMEFCRDISNQMQDNEEIKFLVIRAQTLEEENKKLKKTVENLKEKHDQIVERGIEFRKAEENRFIKRLIFLKKITNQLRLQIAGITNTTVEKL